MARNFKCDKCEYHEVTVKHFESEIRKGSIAGKPERLFCRCVRCDYYWHENTTENINKGKPRILTWLN